jgi:hypothetical protein
VLHDAHAVPGVAGIDANDHALRWPVATDLQQLGTAGAAGAATLLRRGVLLQGLDDAHGDRWNEWLAEQRRHWDETWRAAVRRQIDSSATQAVSSSRAVVSRWRSCSSTRATHARGSSWPTRRPSRPRPSATTKPSSARQVAGAGTGGQLADVGREAAVGGAHALATADQAAFVGASTAFPVRDRIAGAASQCADRRATLRAGRDVIDPTWC